ncbi:dihydrofolate reductase [Rhodophyticola sp. CCM32]|uniref:dihydrofolate reductase family protein n=1 Tax=Rhodophyticola sp. CCM32 TaxID=2916397 RepID=UPI00107EEFBA|nr:dihydrofolate reductase family protein [Rhodophyticola sp. CCM32]QBX99586.1 dihydrofolate reductase [Rhodophyticola sp. CCM32]
MLRGYISCSADGYVADTDGGVGFLDPFQDVAFGHDAFFAGIDTVVMGRHSYDQIIGFDVPWPYAAKTGYVVTSSPLGDPPADVTRWSDSLESFAGAMRDHQVWVVGGARLQAGFISLGLLSRLELFIIPVLLGAGIPLYPAGTAQALRLTDTEIFDKGIVKLDYQLANGV